MKFMIAFIALAYAADLLDRGWVFFPTMLLLTVFSALVLEPMQRSLRRWWRRERKIDPDSDTLSCLSRALIGWPKPQ